MKNNINKYVHTQDLSKVNSSGTLPAGNKEQNQDDEEIIVATPVEPWVPEGPEIDLDELYEDEKK